MPAVVSDPLPFTNRSRILSHFLGSEPAASAVSQGAKREKTTLKRGHPLTYASLFLFTILLYARPAEFYPSPVTASIALIVGLITLGFFVPTQLSLEGNLTAPLKEVNLVLLFGLLGLLSIPLAISPADGWHEFSGTFIRCIVIFIVMVNVVRTHARLRALLFVTLAVSIWLSLGAVNDYRLGLMTVEGYRVGGRGGGIFGNPNDMALHLVTVFPVAIALCFATRRTVLKMLFGAAALLMLAAVVLTYSRGGFIGLLVASAFLAWKIGHRHRFSIAVVGLVLLLILLALAPDNYAARLASIFVPSLDPVGSADMRREILFRSISTAIRHPLLGIGMGNFHNVSIRELVSHNAYTQVASEMGIAALITYTMFIVTPLKKLGEVASQTFAVRDGSRYYYLAIGLQSSLLGYMICSLFASVAYLWYVYYLVGYAVCLRRLYEAETGQPVEIKKAGKNQPHLFSGERNAVTI
ncbi:MAG: O-antigen ligase family protein [Pyrinomonadaceae bacterium]